jgi:hypothetical protein
MTTGKYVTPIGSFFSAVMACLKFRVKVNGPACAGKLFSLSD